MEQQRPKLTGKEAIVKGTKATGRALKLDVGDLHMIPFENVTITA